MNHLAPISEELNVAAFGGGLFSVSLRDPRSTSIGVSLLTGLTGAVFLDMCITFIMCITFQVLLCSLGPRRLQKGKLQFADGSL